MRPPLDALTRQRLRPETRPGNTGSDQRGYTRYDPRRRRAQLLQCDRCGAIATGRVTRQGVVVSGGFPVEYGRHTLTSAGRCGGRVVAYDIARGVSATTTNTKSVM